MNPEISRLIALQKLDSDAQDAERRLASEPERRLALEATLETARQHMAAARDRVADNQAARRAIEKDVAMHQGRLSKFREQAMAVKTNQEYQAIQHEIAFAQTEIKALEDKILELMLEADECASAAKRAELQLAADQKTVERDKAALTAECTELQSLVERLRLERRGLVGAIDPSVMATFEMVSRRRHGVAVAEARDGICTICHVRLRPQVFNSVLRNEQVIQCDSCLRILFSAPRAAPDATATQPTS